MASQCGRWVKRGALGGLVLVAVVGGYVALNWTTLKADYTGKQFRAATTEPDRARLAEELLAAGDAGLPYLLEPFQSGTAESCATVVRALEKFFGEVPANDPRFARCCRAVFDGFAAFHDVGKAAALELLPELLKCPDPDSAGRCREMVKAGLTCPNADARVRAVRLALRPETNLTAEVVPLLDAPEPEVRRAAMLAVGPTTDGTEPAIGVEELFRWLHDPDHEVRDLCTAALLTRGLDLVHVVLARQLSDPNPAERIKLLADLRYAGDSIQDVGPWLERLSRDPDPAVRLGAARVALDSRLVFVGWIERLAERDPDPTVRKWVRYFRAESEPVRQAGFTP